MQVPVHQPFTHNPMKLHIESGQTRSNLVKPKPDVASALCAEAGQTSQTQSNHFPYFYHEQPFSRQSMQVPVHQQLTHHPMKLQIESGQTQSNLVKPKPKCPGLPPPMEGAGQNSSHLR